MGVAFCLDYMKTYFPADGLPLVNEVVLLQKGQILFTHSHLNNLRAVICLESLVFDPSQNVMLRCIPYSPSPIPEEAEEVCLEQNLIDSRFMGNGVMLSPNDQRTLSIIAERKILLFWANLQTP
jgi:hypothetical protein